MVGLQTLDLAIGVRVPASQPNHFNKSGGSNLEPRRLQTNLKNPRNLFEKGNLKHAERHLGIAKWNAEEAKKIATVRQSSEAVSDGQSGPGACSAAVDTSDVFVLIR